MELKELKINLLGDSITWGSGSSENAKTGYVALLQSRYGAICRNYGIGGTRIAKKRVPSEIAVHDKDYCGRVEAMDPDADLIVIFGGTNDYGHGDAPIGSMSDRDPYTFYGALHTLFTAVINKYPTSKIMVITPLHRLNEVKENYCLKDFVEAEREVAEYYSLPLLDLYATYGVNPVLPIMKESFMPDGLHPNDAGHALLADKIAAFIRAM